MIDLRQPPADDTPSCPRCGQRLPAPAGALVGPDDEGRPPTGLQRPVATPDELVAMCPFDGHAPYNDLARALVRSGALPVTAAGHGSTPTS